MAFRSSSSFGSGGVAGTTVTLNKPSGAVVNDLLVATIVARGGAVTASPSGWSLVRSTAGTGFMLYTYTKVAGGSEPSSYSWTIDMSQHHAGSLCAYEDVKSVRTDDGLAGAATAGAFSAPSLVATAGDILFCVFVFDHGSTGGVAVTTAAGMVERADPMAWAIGHEAADETRASAGATGTRSASLGSGTWNSAAQSLLLVTNVAPNAPTLTAPVSGTINKDAQYRFDWDFSDPDAGDSQSKFDLRYRLTSGGTWTDITQTTPNTFYDMPAGTLAAGDYEWQVRTYDSQGVVGPYSASAFFTAASTPGVPSITAPTAGSTISQDTAELTWSTPSQEAYRVRKVADNAGVPDTATVYYDSGEVVSASARSATLTFPVNNRVEHLQLSVRDDDLWSSWASVNVTVSYTPPAVPDVTVTSDGGALTVQVTNLPADPGEPAVIGNHLWRREVVGGVPTDPIRLKNLTTGEPLMVTPGGSYTDWAVASRREYEYRPQAVGDNGTSSFGHWPGTVVVATLDDIAAMFDTLDELPLFFATFDDLAAGRTT